MDHTSGAAACRGVRATQQTPRRILAHTSLGFALACLLAGCASSSSETPWPVEPDFERLRAEAKGHPRQAHAGTEWTPREPEGDEVAEAEEEPEPASTWGGRRRAVIADPPPLRGGTPKVREEPDPDEDDDEVEEPAPSPKKADPEPKAPPAGLGDTDDIDNDPFFQDDED